MNNNEISAARAKYLYLANVKELLEKLKSESQDVMQYVFLLNKFTGIDIEKSCNDVNIINEAFDPIAKNTKNSNNLYVNVGTSKYGTGIRFHNVYEDLETREISLVENAEWFERENIVLNANVQLVGDYDEDNKNLRQASDNLRLEFYEGLLFNPQEEVVNDLVKKYGKRK